MPTIPKNCAILGLIFGMSRFIFYVAIMTMFHLGRCIVDQGLMEFQNIFLIFLIVIFTSITSQRVLASMPDFVKAKTAINNIFELLDRRPAIDCYSAECIKPNDFVPALKLENGHFFYPTRPNTVVLNDVSVSVEPGETLALVGTSGCGKSTIINITQRFYDPLHEIVYLDNFDTKKLNISVDAISNRSGFPRACFVQWYYC